MSVDQFLAGLPSYNENNFSRFHMDSNNRTSTKRPSVYISTKEFPPDQQTIVTEKSSILLKYMQQHWEKRSAIKKREVANTEEPSRKRPRLDSNHPNM